MNYNNHIQNDGANLPDDFGPGKDNPFQTPDGYFETLPSRIMDRIKSGSDEKTPVHRIRHRRILFAAAAALLLLISIPFVWMLLDKPADNELYGLEINISEGYYNYLTLSIYDEDDLIDMLLEASSGDPDFILFESAEVLQYESDPDNTDSLTKEDIMMYLLKSGVSDSELYEL